LLSRVITIYHLIKAGRIGDGVVGLSGTLSGGRVLDWSIEETCAMALCIMYPALRTEECGGSFQRAPVPVNVMDYQECVVPEKKK